MNVFVTGANGYLGCELITWLINETSNYIYALDKNWDNSKIISSDKIKRIKLSLDKLKTEQVFDEKQKIDLIIHLAAKISIDSLSPRQAFELMESNCLNLIRLLDWAKEQKITKIVFVSSMTVYAQSAKDRSCDEKCLKAPSSFYGLSKMFGEQIIDLYVRQTKMRAIVLRLPGLFGGNRKSGLIYNLAKQIRDKETVRLDLKGLKQWETIHVSDAAKTIGEIARINKFARSFNVFNVGYEDHQVEIRPIIKLMQKYYKSSQKIVIKNEGDYMPFTMKTNEIKRYLPDYSLDFRKSLFRYLGEIS